jgi:ADP-heptose:LPS heptosyltransferase
LLRSLASRNQFRTVLLQARDDQPLVEALQREDILKDSMVFRAQGQRPLLEVASLIDGAMAVVTTDTSIVHFASAMSTPAVVIQKQDPASVEWLPWGIPHEIVWAVDGGGGIEIDPPALAERIRRFLGDAGAAKRGGDGHEK